jgi:sarcosine/dimethylglycine N-methyltransferase
MAAPGNRVERFYDEHPINEEQIQAALQRRGVAPEAVTPEVLREFDQDHYGGIPALEVLASRAGITNERYVVDLCSGLGGPARHLANTRGCRVVGVDFTASRHHAALRLTALARLSHRVNFCLADVRDVPFPHDSFDVAISQEGFAHVPDKSRLVTEIARLVKPGGAIAFTDIVRRVPLAPAVGQRLYDEMAFNDIESAEGYAELLARNGCISVAREDLTDHWTTLLQDRLRMFRGMRESTIAVHGLEAFERYEAAYVHFVSLYTSGVLGGVRIVARRGRT